MYTLGRPDFFRIFESPIFGFLVVSLAHPSKDLALEGHFPYWPGRFRPGKRENQKIAISGFGSFTRALKKIILVKTTYGLQLLLVKIFCATPPTRGSLSKI